MARTHRRSRIVAAVAASALGLSMSATSLGTSAATAAPDGNGRAAAKASGQQRLAPPGPAGASIVLQDQVAVSGIDMATDPSSDTTYVAWIASSYNNTLLREVHLCVLPQGSTSCQGGTRTVDAIGDSTAHAMHVVVTGPGTATLVWFYQQGITTGKLATATFSGGSLGASTTVADAPNNGELLDVVRAPDGQIWAVTRNDSGSGQNLQVRQGLTGSPQGLVAPWLVGKAQLAFAGSKPVLVVARGGSISEPLRYASGTPWTNLKQVPKTWTVGNYADLVGTKSGVRLIASEATAGYRPTIAKWKGTEFSTPRLAGDNNNCQGLANDLVTDPSGRLANVVNQCSKLAVYNLPQTTRAAIFRFSAGGTVAEASSPPQISTTKRGRGWVAWVTLSPTNNGTKVFVRPIRLPALMTNKSDKASGNKVTVRGPVSCLPVVTVRASVSANPARGWSVVSRSLKFDGDNVGRDVNIDGAKLAEGSTHVLIGKAVFQRGGQRVTAQKRFEFKAC